MVGINVAVPEPPVPVPLPVELVAPGVVVPMPPALGVPLAPGVLERLEGPPVTGISFTLA